MFRVRHLLPISPDFIEGIKRAAFAVYDVVGGLAPDEGLWLGVVLQEVVVDPTLEILDAGVAATSDALCGNSAWPCAGRGRFCSGTWRRCRGCNYFVRGAFAMASATVPNEKNRLRKVSINLSTSCLLKSMRFPVVLACAARLRIARRSVVMPV